MARQQGALLSTSAADVDGAHNVNRLVVVCVTVVMMRNFSKVGHGKKKKPRGFSQTRTSLSCYMCFAEMSHLLTFHFGTRQTYFPAVLLFSTLAADVFMGLLHFGDERIDTVLSTGEGSRCAFRWFAREVPPSAGVPGVW